MRHAVPSPAHHHRPKHAAFDHRPIVAVLAIVIFALAAIALIFTLRAQH
jgi:hypothetical protein